MQRLTEIYPFNLARDIAGNNEDALKIYIPGIEEALSALTEREADILRKRYADKMTLKEVGEIHGVGARRIGQIEAIALRKMRVLPIIKAVPRTEVLEWKAKHQKISQEHELLLRRIDLGVFSSIDEFDKAMQTPVYMLKLNTRAWKSLTQAGKETLRDVIDMTEDELKSIKNIGNKTAEEIKEMVKSYGFEMGSNKNGLWRLQE